MVLFSLNAIMSRIFGMLPLIFFISTDNFLYQFVPYNISLVKLMNGDALNVFQNVARLRQSALFTKRQIRLRQIPVTTALERKPKRVKNIFICSGVVFCASSRMIKGGNRPMFCRAYMPAALPR